MHAKCTRPEGKIDGLGRLNLSDSIAHGVVFMPTFTGILKGSFILQMIGSFLAKSCSIWEMVGVDLYCIVSSGLTSLFFFFPSIFCCERFEERFQMACQMTLVIPYSCSG